MSDHQYALKMRQSLAQFERSFLHEAEQDQLRAEQLAVAARRRTRARFHAREKQKSSARFYVLMLTLVATAIVVAVVMLATLYILLV